MIFFVDTLKILIFISVRSVNVMWQWQNNTFWVGILFSFALSTFFSGWFVFHSFFGHFTKIHLIFTLHILSRKRQVWVLQRNKYDSDNVNFDWKPLSPQCWILLPPSSGLSVNRGLSDVDHQTSFRRFLWCVLCICWQSSSRFSFWFPLHLFTYHLRYQISLLCFFIIVWQQSSNRFPCCVPFYFSLCPGTRGTNPQNKSQIYLDCNRFNVFLELHEKAACWLL